MNQPIKVAIDAMGGDFAPESPVKGALMAAQQRANEIAIVLIGQEDAIRAHLPEEVPANIQIVHADEVIGMAEHPTKAMQQKMRSSIAVGYHLLKEGKVDVFCGAGNTGAMYVGALFSIKAIEGVMRPALISHVPMVNGNTGVILDVGANADCKPEVLAQFAQLGNLYCKYVLEHEEPRVALLSIGEEEQKGNIAVQAAHKILKGAEHLNFVGNIEGRDIFLDKADVIVCDGFIGNIVLKMAESIYEIMNKRDLHDTFFDRMNYEAIGGSPILGINGNVVIGHGISSPLAICNMILLAEKFAQAELNSKIKSALLQSI
ncbi:MAG: phosphate acyltransferase [Thermonema sp.]|nr:MAG: phosphate acyltransferase [Thermonema sp.]